MYLFCGLNPSRPRSLQFQLKLQLSQAVTPILEQSMNGSATLHQPSLSYWLYNMSPDRLLGHILLCDPDSRVAVCRTECSTVLHLIKSSSLRTVVLDGVAVKFPVTCTHAHSFTFTGQQKISYLAVKCCFNCRNKTQSLEAKTQCFLENTTKRVYHIQPRLKLCLLCPAVKCRQATAHAAAMCSRLQGSCCAGMQSPSLPGRAMPLGLPASTLSLHTLWTRTPSCLTTPRCELQSAVLVQSLLLYFFEFVVSHSPTFVRMHSLACALAVCRHCMTGLHMVQSIEMCNSCLTTRSTIGVHGSCFVACLLCDLRQVLCDILFSL